MTPDADTAAAGTCNVLTAPVAGDAAAELASVTLTLTSSDADTTAEANVIGFCNPTTFAPTVGSGATDDTAGAETPATANNGAGEVTGADKTVTFGVRSDEARTIQVQAQTNEGATIFTDISTKTFVAGGADAVAALDCEPETETAPCRVGVRWRIPPFTTHSAKPSAESSRRSLPAFAPRQSSVHVDCLA